MPYAYSVRETQVTGYTTTINGTTITNDLIPQPPKEYTSFSGVKIWRDQDNASGTRPNHIIVRLMRDGVEVARRTVTAVNGWQDSFDNIPVDDGYGNIYTYDIREEAVTGYFNRIDGFDVTNSRLPDRAEEEEVEFETFRDTGTPLAGFPGLSEEELEDLLELFDYGMPLWGEPMKTGDELPLYPIIFGGVGLIALVALIVLTKMDRKRKRMGV